MEKVFDCGCKVSLYRDAELPCGVHPEISRCNLHDLADGLLKACDAILASLRMTGRVSPRAIAAVEAVVAAAKGFDEWMPSSSTENTTARCRGGPAAGARTYPPRAFHGIKTWIDAGSATG